MSEKKKCIKWNCDDINKFLDIFQNYELLWNIHHSDYVNKQKRESAMRRLLLDLQEQSIAVPDINLLRSKIKSIKTTYRQERLKVEESKTSGKGIDDIYVPKLSWYDNADSFLRVVVVSRTSTSNIKADISVVNDDSLVEDVNQEEKKVIQEDDDMTQKDNSLETQPIGQIFRAPQLIKKRRVGKLAKIEHAINKLQKIAENRPTTSSFNKNLDEYDLFGQHIACQMRKLPVRSFIILQQKFQTLITQERLKALESPSTSSSGESFSYE